MSGPTKELDELVISGKLRHGHHPVLRWMASNVTSGNVEHRNVETGKRKPSKKKSTE